MFKFYTYQWFHYLNGEIADSGNGIYHTACEVSTEEIMAWLLKHRLKNNDGIIAVEAITEISLLRYLELSGKR